MLKVPINENALKLIHSELQSYKFSRGNSEPHLIGVTLRSS